MLLAKTCLFSTLIYRCELFASCYAVRRRILNVTYNAIALGWYEVPTNIRMLLAKTYLLATLMYGCELFASYDAVRRRRLNVTSGGIGAYRLPPLIYSVTFDNLMNCPTLLLVRKLIYNRQPLYLYERLVFSRSNRGNRINSIEYHEAISQQHFLFHSIHLWNQLPPPIQTISNTKHFETAILMHFTEFMFSNFCKFVYS